MNIFSNFLSQLGNTIIPVILFLTALTAFVKGSSGFDDFCEGAKEGLKTCAILTPTLIGLLIGTSVLRISGILDITSSLLAPLAGILHFPKELIPLAVIKMFSSSAATSLLIEIYQEYGTDSYNGFLASLMLSSTETIMYLMTIYLTAGRTKYSRYILPGAILTTFSGIAMCTVLSNYIFSH
jgi:spore maturation protein B